MVGGAVQRYKETIMRASVFYGKLWGILMYEPTIVTNKKGCDNIFYILYIIYVGQNVVTLRSCGGSLGRLGHGFDAPHATFKHK